MATFAKEDAVNKLKILIWTLYIHEMGGYEANVPITKWAAMPNGYV